MPKKSIGKMVSELSFSKKMTGIGAILLLLGTFMPWYSDIDSFNTGQIFLGITGPQFFAGYTILLLAALNLFVIGSELTTQKDFFKGNDNIVTLIAGSFALFLLVSVSTVYFHPKFGLNITLKTAQFGLFFAFIGAALVVVGSYLAMREGESEIKKFQSETRESLEKMPLSNEHEKPVEGIKKAVPETPIASQIRRPEQPVGTNKQNQQKTYQPFRTDL
ncbi:hypothetical protein GF340_03455 [Candidatus Peregrinibacteria bacterium]|nr:hypothetical protein [Candidatus Peregrinibacteria bacterium]